MITNEPILFTKGLSKSFSGVTVLKDVEISLRPGVVTAVAGENGAGKSTLMKLLTGVYQPDSGEIYLRGKSVKFLNIRKSIQSGISIIHQELNLLPHLTVTENLFLGREELGMFGYLLSDEMNNKARYWLDQVDQSFDVETPVGDLSIAHQQMVEIARALSFQADIIIMDEPTDALTDSESKALFKVVKRLRAEGKSVVFITHRLNEIFDHCDEVVVLRDGAQTAYAKTTELNESSLIKHMVGRELEDRYPYIPAKLGHCAISLQSTYGIGFSNVSFEGYEGEVLGFSGLIGSGRTEVAKALFGITKFSRGTVKYFGNKQEFKSPSNAMEYGLVYVTEDRKLEGLLQDQTVSFNMTLSSLRRFSNKLGSISSKSISSSTNQFIERFSIKTPSQETLVSSLSGGNQQKVSIARALIVNPRVLILDEPTRGVDVGAKREIYQMINELKQQGLCILLLSSDMPELLGISDRIIVMSQGSTVAEFDRSEATQEKLLEATVDRPALSGVSL